MYRAQPGEQKVSRVTCGAVFTAESLEESQFWTMELLHIAMGWENVVVGPRFGLTSA